ncbi:oligosaccharide flippase family protein [Jannaschia marina]|uniref:oligosaccharide flippase family protein n=1 Tax=Jannaschia marina TaxID=2741674 RepID=UPI0015CD390F|nr:oligosaccharide flippase family protein [Jannaschia marina]
MLRAALLLLSGNMAASGLLFARNLAVAALIPVADYGIAATFALAMAAVEMASSFGLQQQIVQARDGDDPRLQDALTGFQLLRGVLASAVLLALADPIAAFFTIPEVAWAYRLLALVPLLNALRHFDIHRFNRDDRFGPLVMTNTVPALASFLAIWPLALWLGDWRVMLAALLLHAALSTALSHVVAERRWRPVVDRALWARTLRFGWPILLNALVLFTVFQVDKMAVGRILGLAPLGVFALAVTLTLTPALVMANTIQTAALPRLSRLPAADLERPAARTLTLCLAVGLALALAGTVGGWLAAPWLAATGYAGLAPLLGPMAVVQGLRVAKTGTNVVALSQGMTANAILSNLPRVAALGLGIWVLLDGADLLALVWLGAAGEALGLGISALLVTVRAGVRWPLGPLILGAVGFGCTVLAVVGIPMLLVVALLALGMLVWWQVGARFGHAGAT